MHTALLQDQKINAICLQLITNIREIFGEAKNLELDYLDQILLGIESQNKSEEFLIIKTEFDKRSKIWGIRNIHQPYEISRIFNYVFKAIKHIEILHNKPGELVFSYEFTATFFALRLISCPEEAPCRSDRTQLLNCPSLLCKLRATHFEYACEMIKQALMLEIEGIGFFKEFVPDFAY